ncbi:Hypothetical protein PHPALM_8456, partial [Phytophthora palmivora]
MTDNKNTVEAPGGFQLGGFHGRQGGELDMLGVIWTEIPEPTPGTVVPDVIQAPDGIQSAQTAHVVRKATQLTATFSHGGTGGAQNTLTLDAGEFTTSMEAHWGEKDGWTRIFYLNFRTSTGRSVSGGTMTENKGTATAPEGYQLGGFFGRKGGEIDMLGVVWSSIDKIEEVPATIVPADENVVLSEVFGGPHGIAFSDINSIRYSQTVSSLTLRIGARSHGLSLGISAPQEATFSHGGSKGVAKTLVLAPGEYITSMEAHWGKKDGRTRIFLLSFGT